MQTKYQFAILKQAFIMDPPEFIFVDIKVETNDDKLQECRSVIMQLTKLFRGVPVFSRDEVDTIRQTIDPKTGRPVIIIDSFDTSVFDVVSVVDDTVYIDNLSEELHRTLYFHQYIFKMGKIVYRIPSQHLFDLTPHEEAVMILDKLRLSRLDHVYSTEMHPNIKLTQPILSIVSSEDYITITTWEQAIDMASYRALVDYIIEWRERHLIP